jgi:hypothetical protein
MAVEKRREVCTPISTTHVTMKRIEEIGNTTHVQQGMHSEGVFEGGYRQQQR